MNRVRGMRRKVKSDFRYFGLCNCVMYDTEEEQDGAGVPFQGCFLRFYKMEILNLNGDIK